MGGLIDDLWYLLFFKLFAVNIQDCPCKEKFGGIKNIRIRVDGQIRFGSR